MIYTNDKMGNHQHHIFTIIASGIKYVQIIGIDLPDAEFHTESASVLRIHRTYVVQVETYIIDPRVPLITGIFHIFCNILSRFRYFREIIEACSE